MKLATCFYVQNGRFVNNWVEVNNKWSLDSACTAHVTSSDTEKSGRQSSRIRCFKFSALVETFAVAKALRHCRRMHCTFHPPVQSLPLPARVSSSVSFANLFARNGGRPFCHMPTSACFAIIIATVYVPGTARPLPTRGHSRGRRCEITSILRVSNVSQLSIEHFSSLN